MTHDNIHPDYEFSIATEDDIHDIARLKTNAFIDKVNWCCSSKQLQEEGCIKGYLKQKFSFEQCGLVRERNGERKLVGICQLKFEGQPGDPGLPSWAQHRCKHQEAHIEYICVDGSCRGKGIGKGLMNWSDEFSRSVKQCNRITLEVALSNTKAEALYKRQGYRTIMYPDCFEIAVTYLLMGIPGARLMEKNL